MSEDGSSRRSAGTRRRGRKSWPRIGIACGGWSRCAGPAIARADRSLRRAPGGVPPGGPGPAEVPRTVRAAGVPLAAMADWHDAPARAPPAPGCPGAGRRSRGATAGPPRARGFLGGPGGAAPGPRHPPQRRRDPRRTAEAAAGGPQRHGPAGSRGAGPPAFRRIDQCRGCSRAPSPGSRRPASGMSAPCTGSRRSWRPCRVVSRSSDHE